MTKYRELSTSTKFNSVWNVSSQDDDDDNSSIGFKTKMKKAQSEGHLDKVGRNSDSSQQEDKKSDTGSDIRQRKYRKNNRGNRNSWYPALNKMPDSKKRQLRKYFKDLPSDEDVLEDFSCALQRDILVHGRMYTTLNFLCFHSNIFSYETVLVINWRDITSITKDRTIGVIPNALVITMKDRSFTFRSFMSRRRSYNILTRIWRNAQQEDPGSFDQLRGFIKSQDVHLDVDNLSLSQPSELADDRASFYSDSSDSVRDNKEQYHCNQPHEGKKLVDENFPMSVDRLYNMLFEDNSFFLTFHEKRRTSDIHIGEWREEECGNKIRNLSLKVVLTVTFGPKSADATEIQKLYSCSRRKHLYSIDSETHNSNIPYADCFYLLNHYCLRRIDRRQSNLSVYSRVLYKKAVNVVSRTIIERSSWGGLEEFYKAYSEGIRKRANEVNCSFAEETAEQIRAESETDNAVPAVSHRKRNAWILLGTFLLLFVLYFYISWTTAGNTSNSTFSEQLESPVTDDPIESHAPTEQTVFRFEKLIDKNKPIFMKELENWREIVDDVTQLMIKVRFSLSRMRAHLKNINLNEYLEPEMVS